MSGTELLVIALGLVAGYWLMSSLLARKGNSASQGRLDAEADESDTSTTSTARPGMAPPWHHVLELAPDASLDEIRAAYEKLVAQDRAAAGRTADEITAAYRQAMQLRNEEERAG